MQYIAIKKEEKDGKEFYTVNAIPLKNKNKSIVQKIPHPLGSDVLRYETIEEAKDAVTRAGFSYVLPDGRKGTKPTPKATKTTSGYDYSQLVLESIMDKIESSNSSVAAAAILALAEFPTEETFDILFNKIGEDNDLIRKNAISGICRYGNLLQDKIIQALKSTNWVTRNSALTCILNLTETNNIDLEKFIIPLSEATNDSNTIVQTNALTTLAKVYQTFQKNKRV
jgi:vesicle coat complex subunit